MGRWLPKQQREARDKEVVRLRQECGLTQRQIAERLGLHLAQVNRVLRKYRESTITKS